MVRQHHQLNGHEFEQTLGDSKGERSLACCGSWGCKESDVTELLNNNTERVALARVSLDSEASVCLFFGGALGNPAGF